jgi:undecaprenyl phosphate N,N'-diacetylbacillosamine 1-phosphate transferase
MRPMTSLGPLAKRVVDMVVSGSALLVLSPLFLLLAVLVRLTSAGPSLFCQKRLGKGGVPFTIYKFRTMYVNVPDLRNPDGSAYSAEDDPRVTPVGRLLRKTSLDELPQLFNVLRGDMSLVGPRPDQVDQRQYYSAAEQRKLEVKPGLTGLAQINGRNEIPWEQRKQLDLEYVERQSLGLDFSILARTVPYVLLRRDVSASQDPKANDERPYR